MPKGFEFILSKFLKVKYLQPDGNIFDNVVGVPLGGIISPLLSN
jgi:hypothetical protein